MSLESLPGRAFWISTLFAALLNTSPLNPPDAAMPQISPPQPTSSLTQETAPTESHDPAPKYISWPINSHGQSFTEVVFGFRQNDEVNPLISFDHSQLDQLLKEYHTVLAMENANKTLRFHRIHSSGGLGMYVSYPLSYWDGFPDVPDATDAPSMINVPSLNNQIALDLIDGIKEHVDGGSTAFPQNGADVMIKNIKGSDGRNLPLIPVAWLYIFRVFPIQDGQNFTLNVSPDLQSRAQQHPVSCPTHLTFQAFNYSTALNTTLLDPHRQDYLYQMMDQFWDAKTSDVDTDRISTLTIDEIWGRFAYMSTRGLKAKITVAQASDAMSTLSSWMSNTRSAHPSKYTVFDCKNERIAYGEVFLEPQRKKETMVSAS